MRDLGAMGESNLVVERRRGLTRRATLLRAAEIYGERFALPSGRVAASFEVLFLHGWAPHESQPKPLKPGSAAQRLADALGTDRAKRRRESGTRLDRATVLQRSPVGELRLLLRQPPGCSSTSSPFRGSSPVAIRMIGGLAAIEPLGALAEKAIDVVPTDDVRGGLDAARAARPTRIERLPGLAGRRAKPPSSGICSRWPA
jgi:hypothetical protein